MTPTPTTALPLTRAKALPLALLTGALAAALAGVPAPPTARADDTKPTPSAAATAGPTCVIKGTFPGPKGVQIFDASSGGNAIASFTGALQPMALFGLPADPTTGRARISTGPFRVEGWVAPSSISVFTVRDVPVQAGHVWISEAQKVKLVQASGTSIGVELVVPGSGGQTVRATVPCDALGLQHGTPTAMEVPGNGRGYLSRGSSVELFEEPGQASVFTLKVAEGAAQLFWSTESRAGFVHVRTRGTLTIDAWARASSLEPLKKGEMMDQFVPPTTALGAVTLSLDKTPRVAQATREVPLRARRDEKEKTIGALEAGTEVFVIETLLGWSNVLPKNLGLSPAADGGFWVPAGDLRDVTH